MKVTIQAVILFLEAFFKDLSYKANPKNLWIERFVAAGMKEHIAREHVNCIYEICAGLGVFPKQSLEEFLQIELSGHMSMIEYIRLTSHGFPVMALLTEYELGYRTKEDAWKAVREMRGVPAAKVSNAIRYYKIK